MNLSESTHLRILKLIENRPDLSQRELARLLGVSLGKTHYLLRALLDKGFVKMNNFRRSDNKMAYAYVLTPAGIVARLELTRNFLHYKEAEYETLSREILQLRAEVSGGAASLAKDPKS